MGARLSVRVDAELVRRGLARSRRQAGELVAAGRVRVGGEVVAKPSTALLPDAEIVVVHDPEDPGYASRAAFKLAGALDALASLPGDGPVVEGARCLDLGASTGGFTDVLLRRGARHVVAVDVGHGQLVPGLRGDPRVTSHEGLNVRELTAAHVGEAPGLVVADLSFISLVTVLPAVVSVVVPGTDLLLMVKPQFEVGRERLGSGGVVRDRRLWASAVRSVGESAAAHELRPLALVPSPLPGPSGNREFFWWLRAGEGPVEVPGGVLEQVADLAVAWEPPAQIVPTPVPTLRGAS